MSQYSFRDFIFFLVTVLFAMMLTVLPMPAQLQFCRPNWLLLTLFFWFLYALPMMRLWCVWSIGLFQDLLLASPLAMHALSYVLLMYFLSFFRIRIAKLPLWQQVLWVLAISLVLNLFYFVALVVNHHNVHFSAIIVRGLVNCIIWPWVYRVLVTFGGWRVAEA